MWQVSLPRLASIFLTELKTLALLEFLGFIQDYILYKVGLRESDCNEGDLVCEAKFEHKQNESGIEEKTGVERLGSTNLADNMGSMLLIGIAVILALVLLCLLRICRRRSKSVEKTY